MRAIVAVAVVAILVSIVAGNIDARTRGSDSVAAGNSGEESAGSGMYTAVCGPDATHACQTI
jgi:hypothetical protein